MLLSLSFPQLRRWFLKGGIAVLDQGIFSGSNFVFNILLARWLDPAAYGAFSVLFAIYLFLSGFHNALIMEPMTVLGPALYLDRLREFVATQFKLHFFITGGMSILVILVGALLAFTQKGISFGLSLAGLGIFLPFMLLIWLARRIFYVLQIPAGALLSSIVYAIWLIGCSFALVYTDSEVGLSAWFGVMGLAALFGSMAAFWFGKVKVLTPSTAIDLRTVSARSPGQFWEMARCGDCFVYNWFPITGLFHSRIANVGSCRSLASPSKLLPAHGTGDYGHIHPGIALLVCRVWTKKYAWFTE